MVMRKNEPLGVHGHVVQPPPLSRAELARQHIEDPAAIEATDTSPKGVLIFIGGLLASLVVVLLVLWWAYGLYTSLHASVEPRSPLVKPSQVPPEPRIQQAPLMDLKAYEAQQDAILNTYGWVDKNAGVVRIPVAQAIDLLAQRGLPARAGAGPVPTAPDTGAASGGPQTGPPVPRGKVPPGAEQSVPLLGLPESLGGR